MFGYIRPCESKLSKENVNIFKSYYCGVCKSMARRYGKVCQLTLTYDCAFLALFLCALSDCEPESEDTLCVINKKHIFRDEIIDYCADINVLLAYYKLDDDVQDDNSNKARLAKAMLKKSYLRARESHPEIDKLIKSNLDYLYLLEKDKCNEPDKVAEAFGRLLEGVVGYGCGMNEKAMAVGLNLGKYIYLLDAYADYEKDIKDDSYNVFYLKYGEINNLKEEITFLMECILSQMTRCYNEVNVLRNKEIIDNILFLGIIQRLLMPKNDKITKEDD